MRFDRDSAERDANLREHRIRFEDAMAVFRDPDLMDEDATEDEYAEERRSAIGRPNRSRFVVIYGVYTDRPPDDRRIISARRATTGESDAYCSRLDHA